MGQPLENTLKTEYNIFKDRQVSHLHLKAPIAGISVTDTWAKLPLDITNFDIVNTGDWSFDDSNDRCIWGNATQLFCTFTGDAGMQITSTLVSDIVVSLGLFIDGVLKLETPITFDKKDLIQMYGANGTLGDTTSLIQQNSYYELFIKCETGESCTMQLNNFQTMIR